MTTETTENFNLDDYLKDPLSVPEGTDIASLVAGEDKQGEIDSDAPGASEDSPSEEDAAAESKPEENSEKDEPVQSDEEEKPIGVASKDGKHVIPYEELRSTRERAARAEIMVQELTAKLESMANEIETGELSKTRSVSDIVDKDTLEGLREDAPEVASVIDKLIERNNELAKQAQSAQLSNEDQERESRVQQVISVEDAINSIPKLAHVRATDPATFTQIAEYDTLLGKQEAWKDKPLADRFSAAVRMYEAANGEIKVNGNIQRLPVDEDSRVKKAIAKAKEQDDGISTLTDIPGGEMAAHSQDEALVSLSSTALTERFMNMSPEQIEAELARLT